MTSPLANAPGGVKIQTSLTLTQATIVKATPGAMLQLSVLSTGAAAGAIYDCATSSTASSTSNQIAAIPQVLGTTDISFPCFVGIVVIPGSGQKVSVTYQ
jgi:hypothetical protein